MCGIVCYFGSAGNGLTRILSGMSAIIYRAPDSTGIGLFAGDGEPVRTKKALGALPELVESMLEKEIFRNRIGQWLGIFLPLSAAECGENLQSKLLEHEGFSAQSLDYQFPHPAEHVLIDELMADDSDHPHSSIRPGTAGAFNHPPTFRIQDRSDLVSVIRTLIDEYDLSPIVSQTIIRHALRREGEIAIQEGRIKSSLDHILESFREVFEEVLFRDLLGSERAARRYWSFSDSRQVRKELWRLIIRTPVQIPLDFDRDGVRWVLKMLAAAVACRRCKRANIDEEIQHCLNRLWPSAPTPDSISWRELFQAEIAANVYGWAAASAMTFIRENELQELVNHREGSSRGPLLPGQTDPISLRYLATPIIAHGRWALQSANTVINAHPFLDQSGERAVVLNGQFNGVTEASLLNYLRNAAIALRTGNSAEYLPLLWEHYFNNLSHEKLRYEMIFREIDSGLDAMYMGSQAIDYRIYKQVHGKTPDQLDESAFIHAVERIVAEGGQAATAAINARNPARLYVGSHHRPIFIAQRPGNGDVMVVSDVNACLGLFSQREIVAKSRELLVHEKERKESLASTDQESPYSSKANQELEARLAEKRAAILEPFTVRVFPLEGESLFARITAAAEDGQIVRKIEFSDFAESRSPDIEPFEVVINPLQTRRDLHKSFYDAHLEEIPQRLRDLFNAHWPMADSFQFLQLKERNLQRRFGANLEGLKRIVLIGMGSSYRIGLSSRSYFRKILPWVKCDVFKPIEIENISQRIDVHRDLIILLSVSGTSADIIEFANEVHQHHGVMVAATEKPFSDMALVAAKTGGVIPILAGEEVTYSAIKSSVCMAVVCRLLALWLGRKSGMAHAEAEDLKELRSLPDLFEQVLRDEKVREFCRAISEKSVSSYAAITLDDSSRTGTGLEAAAKLEETSCNAIGKALDYRDLALSPLEKSLDLNLVLVNATGSGRLKEAIDVIKYLYVGNIEFAAVSYEHPALDQIRFLSRGLCVALPKVSDEHQPIIDLAFYYQLARDFGLAHGCSEPGFPRNRAKSVTVATQRCLKKPSLREEFKHLEAYGKKPVALELDAMDKPTLWERVAKNSGEQKKHECMRRLSFAVGQEQPLLHLLKEIPKNMDQVQKDLGELLASGGEMCLVAMDTSSLAAALDVAKLWRRLSRCSIEVLKPGSVPMSINTEAWSVFIGTVVADDLGALASSWPLHSRCLWIGCSLPAHLRQLFDKSLGVLELASSWEELASEAIYALLNLILIEALKIKRPEYGNLADRTMKLTPKVVDTILNDQELRTEVEQAIRQNQCYRTAAFMGSSNGTGTRWTQRFDEMGGWLVEDYLYGESGHGPVVTIDPSAARKYVSCASREELLDQYVKACSMEPFVLDDRYYLPLLKPDFDATKDNLIFLDASNEKDRALALAELSLYGCRFARLIVISQQAFAASPEFREFSRYPIGHVLLLPTLSMGDSKDAIPELLMPFAMSIVASTIAAETARSRKDSPRPSSLKAVVEHAFGAIGRSFSELGLGLHSLNHRLLEAIRDIAPLVTKINGVATYKVRRLETEQDLKELQSAAMVYAADQALQNLTKALASQTSFYLVYPEKTLFKGLARSIAEETFADDYWEQWYEVYGNSWSCLFYGRLETDEGLGGQPRLQLALANADSGLCRLLHLYVNYKEWDHTVPMNDQVHETVVALGKYRMAQDSLRSRYELITSQFYNEVIPEGCIWADDFLCFVPRAMLFSKSGKEIADCIAGRVIDLAKYASAECSTAFVGRLILALKDVWQSLKMDAAEDEHRWLALKKMVGDELMAEG